MLLSYFEENICYHGCTFFESKSFFFSTLIFRERHLVEDLDLRPTPILEEEPSSFLNTEPSLVTNKGPSPNSIEPSTNSNEITTDTKQ